MIVLLYLIYCGLDSLICRLLCFEENHLPVLINVLTLQVIEQLEK